MMALVAVAAALLWAVPMGLRWAEYCKQARYYEEIGSLLGVEAGNLANQVEEMRKKGSPVPRDLEREIHFREVEGEWHLLAARRFAEASRRPWLRFDRLPPHPPPD